MTPLRVAVLATNNDKMYSGGRYHALIIAYALALTGADVEFITNEVPRFAPDLAPIAPQRVKYTRSPDFQANLPKGDFDFVIVVPTGIFMPRFYERAMAFARQARARIGLINFESANMFNALSPVTRDTRLWDYWRRLVDEGGLVISSARVSDRYARDFYRNASGAHIRFEVCGPPINSVAAREADSARKDGSVVVFVRPGDVHKGAHDLLELDPGLMAGRTLHVVSGGEPDAEYGAALQGHFGSRVDVQFHSAISDSTKFRLITAANALLFPSRFEGFGYPPVEAAYAGTEIVAYELPVLRETVGGITQLGQIGDVRSLNRQLEMALARGERRAELRAHVESRVDVNHVATRIGDILLRSSEVVPRVLGRRPAVQWGPFERDTPDSSHLEMPPVTPSVVSYAKRLAGDSLLSISFATRAPVGSVQTTNPLLKLTDVHLRLIGVTDGWRIMQATMLLPPVAPGARVTLEARSATDKSVCATIPIELGDAEQLASAMLQLERVEPAVDGGSVLSFVYLGSNQVDEAVVSTDGVTWVPATPEDKRFTVTVREANPHLTGATVFLFDRRRPVAAYGGFPPRRRGRRPSADTGSGELLQIERVTDDTWSSGFLRRPSPPRFGGVRCRNVPPSLKTGAILRFSSGRLARLAEIISGADCTELYFTEPLNAAVDGRDVEIEVLRHPSAAETSGGASQEDVDPSWRNGVWCGEGPLHRRGVMLPWAVIESIMSDAENPRRIMVRGEPFRRIEQVYDCGGYGVAWLDQPWPETAPALSGEARHETLSLDAVSGAGWINGVAVEGPLRAKAVRLRGEGLVRKGQVLRFSRSGLRRISHVKSAGDHTIAVLERPIALEHTEGQTVRLAWPQELEAEGANSLLYANEVTSQVLSPLLGLLDRYRRVHAGEDVVQTPGARRRILFLSVVPPLPADQGNRIVTHNFVRHLVSIGFDIDVVLLGEMPLPGMMTTLGDHVRFFGCPFPDWEKAPSAVSRKKIQEELRNLRPGEPERGTIERLKKAAREFHPYFIVPDTLARIAAALYRQNAYHSIVCNYTHSLRVAKELEAIKPLPPVAVITHDALSRLPLECAGVELDTGYRLCPPEVERDVLNAAPNARILAISRSEQAYFAEIGVTNPIVLCEYDGLGEIRGARATPAAFEGKRLVFQASGNPMNVAALNWFVRNCWPAILQQVPDATLVVSGRVTKGWRAPLANIETHGVLSRAEMLEGLAGAAISLNPTLAGTGLKIKTVEAACAGVPSVCLPAAVEGLEDVADNFAINATTADEFTAACIRLLTDREAWLDLHRRAIAFAEQRWNETAVYRDIDFLMGWAQPPGARVGPFRALHDKPQANADLEAGKTAEANGELSSALDLYLRALARDPTNVAAHDALVDLSLELGWTNDAENLMKHAVLAAPLSADAVRIEGAVALKQSAYRAVVPAERALELPLNAWKRFPDLVTGQQAPGIGWGSVEEWGSWSDGPFTRVKLRHPSGEKLLHLKLNAMAVASERDPPQPVTVFVDGALVLQAEIPRDGGGHALAPINLGRRGEGEITLEILIGNPARVRNERGVAEDKRQLGIGLLGLGLFEGEA